MSDRSTVTDLQLVAGGARHQLIVPGPVLFARPGQAAPPPPRTDPPATEILVLSRVAAGAITRYCGGRYFHDHRPFPMRLVAALYFDGLLAVGRVELRPVPDRPWLQTVALTDAGRARLAELTRCCKRRSVL